MQRRPQIYYLSRSVISLVVLLSIGTLFVPLSNPLLITLDVLFRTYLIFLGTVMAHESVHGHLGRTKAANFWWGRIALLPSMVPFTNFRKTHQLHHAHTNVPERDPDHFMKSRNFCELFVRTLAMPHHWFFWLRKLLSELNCEYRTRRTSGRLGPVTFMNTGIKDFTARFGQDHNWETQFKFLPLSRHTWET